LSRRPPGLASPGFARIEEDKANATTTQYFAGVSGTDVEHRSLLVLENKIENLLSEITVVNKQLSLQIKERLKAADKLEETLNEVKWVNQLLTEREIRVTDLKKEINVLLKKQGLKNKYVIQKKVTN